MLFKLFMKECSQTVKSLTYWLMVIIMVPAMMSMT